MPEPNYKIETIMDTGYEYVGYDILYTVILNDENGFKAYFHFNEPKSLRLILTKGFTAWLSPELFRDIKAKYYKEKYDDRTFHMTYKYQPTKTDVANIARAMLGLEIEF